MNNVRKKFKRWLEFYPPGAATADEWLAFDRKFKKEAPLRYFFDKTFPRKVWIPFTAKLEKIGRWFRYRFQKEHKYHLIDTGLEPGYYVYSHRMLHGCFSLLVDYVEVDRASHYRCWMENKDNLQTNKEQGLAYLNWEMTLGKDNPDQAAAAKVIKDLYIWWTETRPARKFRDPDYNTYREEEDYILYSMTNEFRKKYPEEDKKRSQYFSELHKFEADCELEDDEKFLELIKIRHHLD